MFDISRVDRLQSAIGVAEGAALPAWVVAEGQLDALLQGAAEACGWRDEAERTDAIAWARQTGFDGALGAVCCIPDRQSGAEAGPAGVLIGVGKPAKMAAFAPFALATAASSVPRGCSLNLCNWAQLAEITAPSGMALEADDITRTALLGWALGQYSFPPAAEPGADHDEAPVSTGAETGTHTGDETSSGDASAASQAARQPVCLSPSSPSVGSLPKTPLSVADEVTAVTLGRDLINTPANLLGPQELEDAARGLAELHGARCAVVTGDALLAENYPLIHAVGAASTRAPRLIHLTWAPDGVSAPAGPSKSQATSEGAALPRLAIIGKGVCFDTGGLNLKPGGSMSLMKKDMGGAATALTLGRLIMQAGLNVRLELYIPAVENAVSGNAFRPGDVFPARDGTLVEISNTDAEGRLVLADAMVRAGEDAPDQMITLATLTGAARVALGPDLVPLYSTDDAFAAAVLDAGARCADPLWRMPLWAPYDAWLAGETGQVNHAPETPFAGSVTAALFLARFARSVEDYTHLDLYGWTPKPAPGRPRGGQPQGARALFHALAARYGCASTTA
ncbi:MAG: leucyl aminopeptidase family protein [Pseudomonadota bacterium]